MMDASVQIITRQEAIAAGRKKYFDGTRCKAGHDGLDDFRDYVVDVAGWYRRNRQFNQDRNLLLLCEAAGMVPQLAKISKPLGVTTKSSGAHPHDPQIALPANAGQSSDTCVAPLRLCALRDARHARHPRQKNHIPHRLLTT